MFRLAFGKVEYFEGDLLAEASDLGLKPGEWPHLIRLEYDDGGVLLFRMVKRTNASTLYHSLAKNVFPPVKLELLND